MSLINFHVVRDFWVIIAFLIKIFVFLFIPPSITAQFTDNYSLFYIHRHLSNTRFPGKISSGGATSLPESIHVSALYVVGKQVIVL